MVLWIAMVRDPVEEDGGPGPPHAAPDRVVCIVRVNNHARQYPQPMPVDAVRRPGDQADRGAAVLCRTTSSGVTTTSRRPTAVPAMRSNSRRTVVSAGV